MPVEILSFRECRKGALRGFLNLRLTNVGIEIRDAAYNEKDGKEWIGLPAKSYRDKNGNVKYSYLVKFLDKGRYEKFQIETLKALRAFQKSGGPHNNHDNAF